MMKPFCDVCGRPAIDPPEFRLSLNELTWRGYRTDAGGGGCDGEWIPQLHIRAVIYADRFRNRPKDFKPDLCRECFIAGLQKLLEVATAIPRLEVVKV